MHFPLAPVSLSVCRNAAGDFHILSLDGGGTKGFQTLGVLKEMERAVGIPLWQHFDLIYGTSTGACTGAMLALGLGVDQITEFYKENIPRVLSEGMPGAKSKALRGFCLNAFGRRDFSAFLTRVGIVATDWLKETPIVFKTGSLSAGNNCTVARAVQASCSAYPLFAMFKTRIDGMGTRRLVDGSYSANNPVMFAIADAIAEPKRLRSNIKLVSVGVGKYSTVKDHGFRRLLGLLKGFGVVQKTLLINGETMEQLRRISFPDICTVRINDHYSQPGLAVDFVESDENKWESLFECGRESYTRHASEMRSLLASKQTVGR